MRLSKAQKEYANKLVSDLLKHKRVRANIPTGLGRCMIFCDVAEQLKPATTSVILNLAVVKQTELTISKHFPDCELRVNKVNTDYIIEDDHKWQH